MANAGNFGNIQITSANDLAKWIIDKMDKDGWDAGHRLPTERSLSLEFKLARNTVRKALDDLEAQGLIERHVGRGTFVRRHLTHLEDMLPNIVMDASPAAVIELRLLIEPAAMELVILRASRSDLELLENCLQKCEHASNWREFDEWDMAFHANLMRVTRNELLERIFRLIHEARHNVEWGELEKGGLTEVRRLECQREHRHLFEKVRARDAVSAQRASKTHLLRVRQALFGY